MRWTRQCRARTGSQGGLRPVSDQPARRRPALKRLRWNLGRQHMSRSRGFGGGSRGRQRRVVLAPVAGVKLMEICRAQPGFGQSPIRQRRRPKEFGSGKSALYALKPLRREGRVFRRTLRSPVCILCARSRVLEGTRLSLRPLRFSRASPVYNSGRLAPRECEAVSFCRMVERSETHQHRRWK